MVNDGLLSPLLSLFLSPISKKTFVLFVCALNRGLRGLDPTPTLPTREGEMEGNFRPMFLICVSFFKSISYVQNGDFSRPPKATNRGEEVYFWLVLVDGYFRGYRPSRGNTNAVVIFNLFKISAVCC